MLGGGGAKERPAPIGAGPAQGCRGLAQPAHGARANSTVASFLILNRRKATSRDAEPRGCGGSAGHWFPDKVRPPLQRRPFRDCDGKICDWTVGSLSTKRPCAVPCLLSAPVACRTRTSRTACPEIAIARP